MAPLKQFVFSLLVASALAQPSRRFAPFHYPVDNSTLSGASGTAPGTGISAASTSSAATSVVSAAELYQASSVASSASAEASSGNDSGSGEAAGEAAGSCAATPETVTVTAVNTVTETFTPSAAAVSSEVLAESAGASTLVAGSSAVSSASSAASSAASSGFAYGSGHGYGHMSLHKTGPTASANASSSVVSAAAVSSSSSVAHGGEFYVPSVAAVTITTYADAASSASPVWTPPAWSSIEWSPSSSAASSTSSSSWSSATPSATTSTSDSTESAPAGNGKRGIAYNTASLANLFSGQKEISWAYNWGQVESELDSCFNFIPMLWGLGSTYTSSWSTNAEAAIASGVQYLMSFNEPDQSGQSLISPSDAATGYMTYIQPYAGKVKLGSPAVTNGGGSMGLTWLSEFTGNCTSCQIDFTAIHWYGTESSDFISHCEQAHTQTGKPIWVTEFGVNTGGEDPTSFLQTVLPWLDSQDYIDYYAYFMASDGILVDAGGDALSALGEAYVAGSS